MWKSLKKKMSKFNDEKNFTNRRKDINIKSINCNLIQKKFNSKIKRKRGIAPNSE